MSVPLDDSDSYNDLQIDFSHKNHVFSMDNVSYITKENNIDNAGSRGECCVPTCLNLETPFF